MQAAIPLCFVAAVIETVINCSPENDNLSLPGSDAIIWRAGPRHFETQKVTPPKTQRHVPGD